MGFQGLRVQNVKVQGVWFQVSGLKGFGCLGFSAEGLGCRVWFKRSQCSGCKV